MNCGLSCQSSHVSRLSEDRQHTAVRSIRRRAEPCRQHLRSCRCRFVRALGHGRARLDLEGSLLRRGSRRSCLILVRRLGRGGRLGARSRCWRWLDRRCLHNRFRLCRGDAGRSGRLWSDGRDCWRRGCPGGRKSRGRLCRNCRGHYGPRCGNCGRRRSRCDRSRRCLWEKWKREWPASPLQKAMRKGENMEENRSYYRHQNNEAQFSCTHQ